MDDPYTLTTDRGAEPISSAAGLPLAPGRPDRAELAGFWLGGLVWAPHNTRVVRRSNALQNWSYGRRFVTRRR